MRIPPFLGFLAFAGCPTPTPTPPATDPLPTIAPTGTPAPGTRVPTDCVEEPAIEAQDGLCPFADRVGGFRVENQADFTVVSGDVLDSVVPQDVFVETLAEGDCVLLGRPILFCDPPCAAGETCDGDTCVPFPRATDQGPVFISGLEQCVDMEPVPPGFNYFFNGLVQPAMAAGDPVQLDNAGFRLHASGVAPITFPDGDWVMVGGQDLTITWDTAGTPDARIGTSFFIDQHGSSPLRLECTFDDDGSGVVPAALVDGLIDSGVTGFPAGRIERFTADHTDVEAGCIDFAVASRRAHGLDVDGFTPCNRDPDCPSPQTCDVPNQICVDP